MNEDKLSLRLCSLPARDLVVLSRIFHGTSISTLLTHTHTRARAHTHTQRGGGGGGAKTESSRQNNYKRNDDECE